PTRHQPPFHDATLLFAVLCSHGIVVSSCLLFTMDQLTMRQQKLRVSKIARQVDNEATGLKSFPIATTFATMSRYLKLSRLPVHVSRLSMSFRLPTQVTTSYAVASSHFLSDISDNLAVSRASPTSKT